MKKKMILISAITLLMLFAFAAPVFASQPKQTYIFGAITYRVPANPGTQFTINDVVHARDVGSTGTVVGAPWGTVSQVSTKNFELNTISFTGSGVAHYVNTGAISTIEGITNFEFIGAGVYTYIGPTFTATTNTGGSFVVTDGVQFAGALLIGHTVGQGSVDGQAIQHRTTYTGISVSTNPSTPAFLTHGLAGDSIITGTSTYYGALVKAMHKCT